MTKHQNRIGRHKRIRAVIKGTAERPRLSVFRSNKYIYAQLIDDEKGVTLESAKSEKSQKRQSPFGVGESLAKKAIEKGIKKICFDRGGYKYHGRIKALAEGARKGGLEF